MRQGCTLEDKMMGQLVQTLENSIRKLKHELLGGGFRQGRRGLLLH